MEIPAKKTNKKRNLIILSLAALLIVIGGINYYSSTSINLVTSTTDTEQASIATVTKAEFAASVNGYGRLVSQVRQSVVAYSPGVIKKINYQPGTTVTPETVIVALSNPAIEREVKLKKLKYQQIEAENRQLTANLKRQQVKLANSLKIKEAAYQVAQAQYKAKNSLANKSIISSIEMEKETMQLKLSKLEFEMAQAELANQVESNQEQIAVSKISLAIAKQEVALSEEKLNALNIVAGTHGQLQQLEGNVNVGQYINEGEFLGIVADRDALFAQLRVNAAQATQLEEGMVVNINIKGQLAKGYVTRISPSVVNNQIMVDAAITSDLPTNARVDMDIEASIFLTEQKQSLVIARHNKVTKANSQYQVLKQSANSEQFLQTTIEVGHINQDYVQILRGSQLGDKLIFPDAGI